MCPKTEFTSPWPICVRVHAGLMGTRKGTNLRAWPSLYLAEDVQGEVRSCHERTPDLPSERGRTKGQQ